MCAYLVLFGPLALLPQILTTGGTGEAHTGLVLTALPAGFALAALTADRVLPRRFGSRACCLLGGTLAALSATLLALSPVVKGSGRGRERANRT